MNLPLFDIIAIIEAMENYVESIRPPEKIHDQLDYTYEMENQSLILLKIRPVFKKTEQKHTVGYVKAPYVKSGNKWNVYWMHSTLKWTRYNPCPSVSNLADFVKMVEEDACQVFYG